MKWIVLQFPWVDRRPLKEEELGIVNSHDISRGIEGMNLGVLPTIIECLTLAGKHEYEPQTDYRKKKILQSSHKLLSNNIWADRKGTIIHPVFQRR